MKLLYIFPLWGNGLWQMTKIYLKKNKWIPIKVTIKYEPQIFKMNITQRMWGNHNYHWPIYYLNCVYTFSASNLTEIKNKIGDSIVERKRDD